MANRQSRNHIQRRRYRIYSVSLHHPTDGRCGELPPVRSICSPVNCWNCKLRPTAGRASAPVC